jgi:hypothetical protein
MSDVLPLEISFGANFYQNSDSSTVHGDLCVFLQACRAKLGKHFGEKKVSDEGCREKYDILHA